MTVTGAKPEGATDEASSAAAVRQMFNDIAPRYDLLNRVLSLNVAELWWRRTARHFSGILQQPEAHIADVCCGTGSMTAALLRLRPKNATPVLAIDFSRNMLQQGHRIFARSGVIAVEANAMHLPLADASTDLIVSAFGFRNLPNYDRAFTEMLRVLKPGGQLGILEANEPGGVLGKAYDFYFHRVLPTVGARLSGAPEAYRYLPASVRRFPLPPELTARARAAGFARAEWHSYTFGIAGLYCCTK